MPHRLNLLFFYFATLTALLLLLFGLSILLSCWLGSKCTVLCENLPGKRNLENDKEIRWCNRRRFPCLVNVRFTKYTEKWNRSFEFLLWIMSLLAVSLHFAVLSRMKHIYVECMYVKNRQIQNSRSMCWNSRHRYDASVPSNLCLDAFNIYSFFTRMSACINTSITWSWSCGPQWNMIIVTSIILKAFLFLPIARFLHHLSPDRFSRCHPFHRQELTVRTQITHVLNLAQEVNLKEDIRTLPSQNDGLVACGGDGWGNMKVLRLDGNFHQKRGVLSRDWSL